MRLCETAQIVTIWSEFYQRCPLETGVVIMVVCPSTGHALVFRMIFIARYPPKLRLRNFLLVVLNPLGELGPRISRQNPLQSLQGLALRLRH